MSTRTRPTVSLNDAFARNLFITSAPATLVVEIYSTHSTRGQRLVINRVNYCEKKSTLLSLVVAGTLTPEREETARLNYATIRNSDESDESKGRECRMSRQVSRASWIAYAAVS